MPGCGTTAPDWTFCGAPLSAASPPVILTITAVNDSLRIVAIGATFQGEELAPSPRTLQHVQGFVEQCITVDRTKTVTREES
jgi:hypothetical protein